MKVIETYYKGYLLRSRLEARWCVWFDNMGYRWEYEIEGFDLDGIKYLPDFWLHGVKMWVEVKPTFQKVEMNKLEALAELSGNPVLILIGVPAFKNYNAVQFDPINKNFELVDYSLVSKYYPERFPGGNYIPDQREELYGEDYKRAVIAARSARFEHDRYQISEIAN